MSNNRIILDGCITQFKESNEIDQNASEVFELFSLSQIYKNRNLTFENIQNSIVDGRGDGGVDSIMVLIDEEVIENLADIENFNFTNRTSCRFIISQCKKERSFKESTLDKLITTTPILFNLENSEQDLLARFNPDVVNAALLLREVWQSTAINGGKIFLEFIYATNAATIEVNDVFISKKDQLIELTKGVFSTSNVDYVNYSSSELLEFYRQQKSSRLSLEFKDQPLSTLYNDGVGYVGTVTLSKYKEFLTSENGEIRDDLFESNIRHFQGNVDVNKKIKETLITRENKDFWWLNNGITIIAEEPSQIGRKISLENIQIVNGLQTSYSIFNHFQNDDDDERSVLVKVIISNDKETIDNIIASTNSQNPVSATLLRATELIQRNIELFFLNEGYYYDRRKNYYKNQGKPTTKIFSIQNTAQTIETIVLNNPHKARATPTSLLKSNSTYDAIFNPEKNFKGYLNCCLIYKKSHTYYLNMEDFDAKSEISNFKLHLSWLASKFMKEDNNLTFEEIVNLDLEDYTLDMFNETVYFLIHCIDTYMENNTGANLINMAKSGDFTDYLREQLISKFAS